MINVRMLASIGILIILLSSCKEDLLPTNIKARTESFTIKCGEATELSLSNGDILTIADSTFECNNVTSFTLTVNTVKTKREMIFSGLQTVDSEGQLLESAGMIQIDYPHDITLNSSKPIIYAASSNVAYDDMQTFTLDDRTNSWVPNSKKAEISGNQEIVLGQRLFETKCALCHSKSLGEHMTGPALAHVEKFRTMDWLKEYTRNSQAMIASGDSIAICTWNSWKPTIMTAFPDLTDNEIEAIYRFIANESKVKRIQVDSTNFIYDCSDRSKGHSFFNNPTNQIQIMPFQNNYYHVTELATRNWYNVDRYYDSDYFISNPTLKIKNVSGNLRAMIVFKNENSFINFTYSKTANHYILQNSFDKEKIQWIKDTDLYLLAYTLDQKGNFKSGAMKEIQFEEKNNDYTLTLKYPDENEFFKFLKE